MGIVDRIDCYGPNIEAKKHMFKLLFLLRMKTGEAVEVVGEGMAKVICCHGQMNSFI